ncbi:MAG: hypothetical protein WCE75_05895, partial [Terracidiphilus sp.]
MSVEASKTGRSGTGVSMRNWVVSLLLAALALPAIAVERTSIDQLERLLATTQSRSDADLSHRLAGLELTERLSSARLAQLSAALPGEKSRQALLALADCSAFLAPPASEIPATATPDAATQRRMLSLSVDYLAKTLPLLPNLFAARDTLRFESRPATAAQEVSLRPVSKARVTVLYRGGREYVDAGKGKDGNPPAPDRGLTTWGEFGPILGTVVIDAARSTLTWSHWELGDSGPRAVFRYAVPKDRSHYDVRFCCTTAAYGMEINVLTQRAGYHGEMTVDPDSGTILRLTVIADLDPGNPIARAAIAVEYGPVEIGGKTYFCPVRGIALAQSPDLRALGDALAPAAPAGEPAPPPAVQKASLASIGRSPQQILLNDIAFREFHIFRAEARFVPGPAGEPAAQPPAASSVASASAPAEAPPVAAPNPETAIDSSTLAAQPPATVASAAESAAPAQSQPREPALPEISVAPANG